MVNVRNRWKLWEIMHVISFFLTRRFRLFTNWSDRVRTFEAVWLMLGELLVKWLGIITNRWSLLFLGCKLKSFVFIGLQAAKAFQICMFVIFVEWSLLRQMMWLKGCILVSTDLVIHLFEIEEIFSLNFKFAEGFLRRAFDDFNQVHSWGEQIDLDVFQVLLLLAFLLQRTAFIHWELRYFRRISVWAIYFILAYRNFYWLSVWLL